VLATRRPLTLSARLHLPPRPVDALATLVGKQPGYIALSCLKSKDGRRIRPVAQRKHVRAYRINPEVVEYFEGVLAVARRGPW